MNLLKQEGNAKCGIKDKRLKAAWNTRYLERVLQLGTELDEQLRQKVVFVVQTIIEAALVEELTAHIETMNVKLRFPISNPNFSLGDSHDN